MVKTRYKVDLPRQHAQCEANYARLRQLMPGAGERRRWRFAVALGEELWHAQIRTLECSRYTTTVELARAHGGEPDCQWLYMPELTVRLYHDARMAEVLAWERHRRLRPRYHYPNPAMYQHDEKAQINAFLGEWLSLCLARGRSHPDELPQLGE